MPLLITKLLIAAAFGLASWLWQRRNGVRLPIWYIAIYAVLFNVGAGLLLDAIL